MRKYSNLFYYKHRIKLELYSIAATWCFTRPQISHFGSPCQGYHLVVGWLLSAVPEKKQTNEKGFKTSYHQFFYGPKAHEKLGAPNRRFRRFFLHRRRGAREFLTHGTPGMY